MSGDDPAEAYKASPVAQLSLRPDGVVVAANDALLEWVGKSRAEVVGTAHITDLLTAGGRIYWETHLSPLLHAEKRVNEIAIDLRGPDGRLPALLSAVARLDERGQTDLFRVALSSARERRRYETELLRARVKAERAANRLNVLQTATASLSEAVGIDGVVAALLSAIVGPVGASSGTVWLSDPDEGLVAHESSGERLGEVAVPVPGPLLRTSEAIQVGGRFVVPLHGQSELQGLLSLAPPRTSPTGGPAEPMEVETLTAIGQQAGLALERARLFERSARVANSLQQSLLGGVTPNDPRFLSAPVYLPGVEGLVVGGDWYDLFFAEDDLLSIVVGDVVGRGLAAASAMGQLRSAVRAVAGPKVGPGRLFGRLDRFVDQVDAASFATLVYAELDLRTGLLTYACAGHPPPLLVPASGSPRLLWGGRSTPLGAFVEALDREEEQIQLQPGDRLLLYTDGLVERRDRDLDTGLDLLREAASSAQEYSVDLAVRLVTGSMLRDETHPDDVCALMVSWEGPSPGQ